MIVFRHFRHSRRLINTDYLIFLILVVIGLFIAGLATNCMLATPHCHIIG